MQKPVSIKVSNAGKKFGREWIFRKVSLDLLPGEKTAILGLNGSGKSTLLQALTGYLTLNEGSVHYFSGEKKEEEERVYKLLSLASPYLELIEDFTLEEHIAHVAIYKPFMNKLRTGEILEISGLTAHASKYIGLFSSGMRQRVKLVLAVLADAPVLLLDEPTTNLDAVVIEWYKKLIADYAMNKTIIVCSNSIKEEYAFCDKVITMEEYKVKK